MSDLTERAREIWKQFPTDGYHGVYDISPKERAELLAAALEEAEQERDEAARKQAIDEQQYSDLLKDYSAKAEALREVSLTRDFVHGADVIRFMERATPDMSDVDRAGVIGFTPRRLYTLRRQRRMTLNTAENILDAFDLGYLLSTGDVNIESVPIARSQQQVIEALRQKNVDLRDKVKYWTQRAKYAESKNVNVQRTP